VRRLLLAALLLAACSGRDSEGLGAHYEQYRQALRAGQSEDAVRALYQAYLDAFRQHDPGKVMRFLVPDMQAESRNAMRLGAEFAKVMVTVEGRITDFKDLGDRALLKASEKATFNFRGKTQTDQRDRVYQLRRVGGDWYFEPPDLGRARQPK